MKFLSRVWYATQLRGTIEREGENGKVRKDEREREMGRGNEKASMYWRKLFCERKKIKREV